MKEKMQSYGLIVALLLIALMSPVIISVVNNTLLGSGRERVELEAPNETEEITIQIDKLLLGEELIKIPFLADLNQQGLTVSAPVLMLILAGVFVGGIVVVGGGIAFAYKFLDRFVLNTKEDKEFQTAQAQMEQKQKEELRLLKKTRPADPIPSHEEPRWSVAATSIIALLFAWFMGFLLADSFFTQEAVQVGEQLVASSTILSWIFIVLTAILLAFVYRPRVFIAASEASANKTTDWGLIWVLVAGFLMVGVGVGLMIAVRVAGS